ncbi:MAG: TfuA-like protein [Pseudomonadota bacterium]
MDSSLVIFAGPSLAGSPWLEDPRLTVKSPCKQGDIYLACADAPKALGIIDGYFEAEPAVWHKEILWALSQGIHVLGAASIGALRAAELAAFGMVGVGDIYQSYQRGDLDDDDDVALLHAPGEAAYTPLTVPMVNVRATLTKAASEGVVSPAAAERIISSAKRIFYKNRSWEAIWASFSASRGSPGASPGTADGDVDTLARWVADNELDQKRVDAELLCQTILGLAHAEPFAADFEFEVTEFWWRATRDWDRRAKAADPQDRSAGSFRLFS